MSAEELRAAAAKARRLADGVPAGRWEPGGYGSVIAPEAECDSALLLDAYGGAVIGESMSEAAQAHVVAWQPSTARAVADLLEAVAVVLDQCYLGEATEVDTAALAVARAMLGAEGR